MMQRKHLDAHENEEVLLDAIESNKYLEVLRIVTQGINLNQYRGKESDIYLDCALDNNLWEIVKILIQYGATVYSGLSDDDEDHLYNNISLPTIDIRIVKLLLHMGSNPNFAYSSEVGSITSRILENDIDYKLFSILLSYSGNSRIHIKRGLCNCNALTALIGNGNNLNIIKLLLSYGTDPAIPDEYGDSMLSILARYKDKYTQEEYIKIKKLLNPKNPPYLKLGESDEDKYIIYENKFFEALSRGIVPYTDVTPHILANKQKHPNKKYLYADNKSDAFVYWAYKNNLLTETLEKVIKKYISIAGEVNAKNIGQLITSTIGDELTSDMFNVEGKPFAVSYPTVTHWWYNLHTDFNRLYQDEDNRLPRAIKSQEEFDTLMKLLDIRYEQFKSGKDFNSNQNKAELQALLEGKEPPKREVDLSWLEEHCGEDDVSDNGAEKEKSEINNANKDNIIPDDFFVQE